MVVAHGTGELLVLLRANERLRPGAVRKLRELAARTGADVLSWAAFDETREDGTPADPRVLVPLDGPALAGLLYPAFATAGFAIMRGALDGLGGFATDARGDDAEHDLLNRACLAGLRFELVPEPLAVVQRSDDWTGVRSALTLELGHYRQDREQQLRIARGFIRAPLEQYVDLPALHLALARKSAAERLEADVAYKELADQRHEQAEYVAYLESEHHKLSHTIHTLQAQAAAPRTLRRRALARIKRKLLGWGHTLEGAQDS
jgi:hypothetical protein